MKKFAFIFPGQGSQAVGMLDAWAQNKAVQETIAEASQALGQDIGRLIAQGPKETLALTENTQPVMLVAGVAAYKAWLASDGTKPSVMAGHSLGEYSALVAAGVLSMAQAAPLVRLRAQAMQEAVPLGAGAMAAVLGLEAAAVCSICDQVNNGFSGFNDGGVNETVQAVNFNEPLQTVIAGSKAAVTKASAVLKEAGARRVLLLPVSAPFHSSLMRPAAEKLAQALATIDLLAPEIPVIHNVNVAVAQTPAQIRDALYQQAFGPVRWVESVQAMIARGVHAVIECGPGKVLTGMTKRIAPDLPCTALYDPDTLNEVKAMLQ